MSHDSLIMFTGVACDAELWRAQRAAMAEITECSVIDPQGLTRLGLIKDTEGDAFESVLDRLRPLLTHVSRHADTAFQAGIKAMMLRVGARLSSASRLPAAAARTQGSL